MSLATFYKWEAKYGGMDVSDACKLKTLESEKARLKRFLAEAELDKVVLKDFWDRTDDAPAQAEGGSGGYF